MVHRFRFSLVLSCVVAGSLSTGLFADHGPSASKERCLQRIEDLAASATDTIARLADGTTAAIAGFGNLAGGIVAENIARVGTRLVNLVARLGTEFVERVVAFCVHSLGEEDAAAVASAGSDAVSEIEAARDAAVAAIDAALNP